LLAGAAAIWRGAGIIGAALDVRATGAQIGRGGAATAAGRSGDTDSFNPSGTAGVAV
jgi:hypothetical protein